MVMFFVVVVFFFGMNLVQYYKHNHSTVVTDGLELQLQGISSHSAECTHAFPAVYGLNISGYPADMP